VRPAVAVIPTIGHAPQMPALVRTLLESGADTVLLIVNVPFTKLGEHGVDLLANPPDGKRVRVLSHTRGIYDSWNAGLDLAQQMGAYAVVLNDDVSLHPHAMAKALSALEHGYAIAGFDAYERPEPERVPPFLDVSGSFRHGGVPGFAFAADPEACARVDTRFEWWYGDDDLFFATEGRGGRLCVRLGAWVGHQAETTAVHYPWTIEARARDVERFREKWGHR
jgi:hypothetical protein